jgi:hypothetical protein
MGSVNRFLESAVNLRTLLLAAALPLVSLPNPASAEPSRSTVAALSLEHLKTSYLACDKTASETVLDLSAYQRCALIADELLQRGFDGDFDRMLAWWRAEKPRFAQAEPASTRR